MQQFNRQCMFAFKDEIPLSMHARVPVSVYTFILESKTPFWKSQGQFH